RINAPIALFVYNRPQHTRQTVEALLANELANESDLLIFADGPKSDKNTGAVRQVREYIHSVTGFKSIKINEKESNQGLANSIIAGVTEVVSKYGKIIVLEDDMVASPYFLRYMNDALDMYENEDKIISIHGYVYPVKEKLPETFFLCNPGCWGWATWKRGWDLFEPNGEKLLDKFKTSTQKKRFNFDNSFPFYKMLKDQIKGKVDSWAIRWYASAFLQNKLTLWPGKSLVLNIGMDNSGSHCSKQPEFDTELSSENIQLNSMDIVESTLCRHHFAKYFRTIKMTFMKKIKNKMSLLYGRNI
ncbi:MAG: glycosyltransferase, partial [Victivallaceae bacterium]